MDYFDYKMKDQIENKKTINHLFIIAMMDLGRKKRWGT